MTTERKELLDCSAESHRRIAELEAENKALLNEREASNASLWNANERERLMAEDALCLRKERESLQAENKALREHASLKEHLTSRIVELQGKIEKLEAACAEMRRVGELLVAVARAAWELADNTCEGEVTGTEHPTALIEMEDFDHLSKALDSLDALPNPPNEEATGPRRAEYAISYNCVQPLLDRMRAMEEILNDLSHRSIHGFDHRIKSDCGCVSNCPACQWEALKKAKP